MHKIYAVIISHPVQFGGNLTVAHTEFTDRSGKTVRLTGRGWDTGEACKDLGQTIRTYTGQGGRLRLTYNSHSAQ